MYLFPSLARPRAMAVASALLLVGTSLLHAQGGVSPAGRRNVVSHESDPAADIVIAPEFAFLGRVHSQVMDGKATAEQHWFARREGRRITRMVVVHFERWNDGVEGSFSYPTLRLQRLGAHEYLHQSFPMESHCAIATEEVRAMIRTAGLRLARECVGTRFVRAASIDRRSEMILFYLEPVDTLPATDGLLPGGLPAGYDRAGAPATPWGTLDRRLTEEALRTIEVRDRK